MSVSNIVEKVYYDINLVQNQSYVYVGRLANANKMSLSKSFWNNSLVIYWSKYQIKETDMRQKTATFTSPNYFDLTTGLYVVLITSPYHEDFGGIILSVDYDKSTGLYEYQCQDFSRKYQSKFNLISKNNSYYDLLRLFITQLGASNGKGRVSAKKLKNFKYNLSGLRPKLYYDQGIWENGINFNPMTTTKQMVFRDVSFIEAIRDLVFSTGAYIDVFFDKYGVLQIKPFSKQDWLENGIYLTTPELASRKFKFDTTNIITGVVVNSEDRLKSGRYYSSTKLVRLDLSAFFGNLTTTIDNPNKTSTSSNTAKKSVSTKKSTKSNKKEGTGITVFMNTDNIHSKTKDMKLMKDIAKYLKKRGYKTEIGGIGPSYHYSQINRVKKNGIYLCIYGGACAGTLKEHWSSNHYKSVLKKKKAKMVVAFLSPPSTNIHNLKWLPRAHDDNFSPRSFKGVKNPEKNLLNAGVGVVIGKNAKEIASKFPNFKTTDKKTKTTKSSKKTKSSPINTNTALYLNNEISSARNRLSDSIRDLLSFKLTLPLGNPLLKKLHTNMFLYTELPDEFVLENFSTIAEVLNSTYNRYVGYSLNRWYVEAVSITNDGSKFEAELELNPFPSSVKKYRESRIKWENDYTSALQSNNSSSKTTTKTKTTSKSKKNTSLKGGEGKVIDNLVKKIVGNETNALKKAKLIHSWLLENVTYSNYTNTKYSTPVKCYNNRGHLNCADTSRLTASMLRSAGVDCYVVHSTCHYYTVIKYKGKLYCSDATSKQRKFNTYWRASSCKNGKTANFTGKNCYYAVCGKAPCS